MKKMWLIIASVIFLVIYLNFNHVLNYFSKDIMEAEILPMEEINALCEGKEDVFIEPQITFNDGKIAYDSEQNMLLIPQNLSEKEFDGKLQVPEGKLYFAEDQALENKAETIRNNKVVRLFWITDTQCWMYNVYFTGMPVAEINGGEYDDQGIAAGNIWIYDPYHSSTRYQSAECTWHLRGATTLNYEKSSYRLTLVDTKLSLLGMRKDDDWILHGLYDDGLIHNKL